MDLIYQELSGKVVGAGIAVHKKLGPGFLETVYEQALKIELAKQGIGFESQKKINITYDGSIVGTHILDMIVEGKIILELKAVDGFDNIHFAQLRSYLRATGLRLGLLMNFNRPRLAIKRIVN